MAKGQGRDAKSSHVSDAVKKYLVEGESVQWHGRPATIVIMGRGVILVALSLVLAALLWFWPSELLAIGVALLACVLMMVTDTRYGLIEGALSLVIVLIVWGFGTEGLLAWLLLFPLAYSLFYLLANVIYLGRVLFVITDRRVITRYGIFSLRYAELDIERIQNITVMQPWYERLLGYGDVFFATAGEKGGIDYQRPGIKLMSGGAVTWEDVSKPFEVVRRVNETTHRSTSPQGGASGKAPVSSDAEERLSKLNELNAKGLISPQEYQLKREEILKKI